MTVLQDILEWSGDRPMWQGDALRRIVTQESLTDNDVKDLLRICLEDHGNTDAEHPAPNPIPLALEHLPQAGKAIERVQLVGLRDVQGVNALAPDQQLTFELDGMTIIFGGNGSGKSGYARILRSLCHARHSGDRILSDVYASTEQSVQSAMVDFRVGGANRSEVWKPDQAAPADLGRISFFDSACASVHVDGTNELAFTPFGLDILPKLAAICRRLSESLDKLIHEQEKAKPASLADPKATEGTSVRKMIDKLDKNSDIEAFRHSAELSENEVERIKELKEALGTDSVARAHELRNKEVRLRRLLQKTDAVVAALSTKAVEIIRVKHQDFCTKRNAARTAAEDAFSEQPLSGVGDKVWRELWEAARKYSSHQAYPEQEFPFTGPDALCVLCQQPLEPNAQERLTKFETFIKTATQQSAEQAETELTQATTAIHELVVGHAAFNEHLSDFPDDVQDFIRSVRRFYGVAWKLKRKILQSVGQEQWLSPCDLPATPGPELDALLQRMLRRADELKCAAAEEERSKLIIEQNELLARQWLGNALDDIECEIARKRALSTLNAAKRDTNTRGITLQSTKLTDLYVTDLLRDRMTREIKDIGAGYLQIELEPRGGQDGLKQFKIALQGASKDVKVRDVLSEGEFRAIALAAFLAELSTEQSGSALIFDDPVSSLDHNWRRKVAIRLVNEAKIRQVIVFTHEIAFMVDLFGFCTQNGVDVHHCYLRRCDKYSGECLDELPWPVMTVKKRIGKLNRRWQDAEALSNCPDPSAYEPYARSIYGSLRETWERCVEEILINGVVTRFDRGVHTHKLRCLADITDEDIKAITDGMTKCSRFMEGHDEAGALMDPVPDPAELKQDIEALEQLVAQIRKRRN